jgi:hypothetical protein
MGEVILNEGGGVILDVTRDEDLHFGEEVHDDKYCVISARFREGRDVVEGYSFKGKGCGGKGVEDASLTSASVLESLAFRASEDVFFHVSMHSGP